MQQVSTNPIVALIRKYCSNNSCGTYCNSMILPSKKIPVLVNVTQLWRKCTRSLLT
ncbi:hypothetical protein SERLADRAFT_454880 [Serpula lacrymans var. lacrymans S7.9]|uniref:Uncharacterized protein n=1 Tax=Serpula lacrymans var. lacrymans (strain S7.9) TaxID=578457 RepID=F8NEE8_SERL9|nr:uncharacterized protein SERLADRAFT_454880 [Serpula lacrymans var. lacrymans S7.9]EGO30582.1 hypothetical protein SERLADRAFT_454880 [Serpula lacrymans var. lacrymans S7.9]